MGSPTQSVTSISTGTGVENEKAVASQATEEKKTRFSSRQPQGNEKHAEVKLASAELKANKRPTAATAEESADEKVQAAPLGLMDPTAKKKKSKRNKGQPKERLQEQTKPAETPSNTVAPTVNPALGTTATGDGALGDKSATRTPATADHTTLPPAQPTPNNPVAPGTPIPATTSASPNAPPTTPQ